MALLLGKLTAQPLNEGSLRNDKGAQNRGQGD